MLWLMVILHVIAIYIFAQQRLRRTGISIHSIFFDSENSSTALNEFYAIDRLAEAPSP